MSSAFDIQGRNCIFQIKVGDIYLDVLCAKTFSFNRTYELKETTTVLSGFDKEFRPRKKSYTISFNGVVQVEADASKPTIKTLFDHGEGFLPVDYRLIYEDNSSNVLVINGQVYVSSAIFNANPINLLDGTIEMTGNGPIERLDFIPEFINVVISVTGIADARCRFILYNADGTIAYDTSTALALLPTGGWLVQGESITLVVQKGQYAYGISVDDAMSATNTFDLDTTPAVALQFTNGDYNTNSLPTVYDFQSDKTAVFNIGATAPPPSCVAPAIIGSPSLPDATAVTAYSYSFPVSGLTPFNISNVTKPAWMTIAVSGSTIVFGGLVAIGDIGNNFPVEFDINNACGSVTFSDTIDVNAPGVTPNDVDWDFTRGGLALGAMKIYVNAVLVVDTSVTNSGTFNVNPGDTVEAQVIGFTTKTLTVENNTTTLYNHSGTAVEIYTFTTVAGQDYTITGSTT